MPYNEPTLCIGDIVCISKARLAFEKCNLAQWTEEIFTIMKRKSTQPPTFLLADYSGEVLKGTFYPRKLLKMNKTDIVYRENTEGDKESSLREMAEVSRQVQQLSECERSHVIFHLVVLLIFIGSILLLASSMKESKALSFGNDYLIVENYINSTMKTSHSVWWRMLMHAHGVVLEDMCWDQRLSICVKCCSFWA